MCDHSRRILGTTMVHPGTWNDKTLVLFDELIIDITNGSIPDDFELKLYEKKVNGEIGTVVYKRCLVYGRQWIPFMVVYISS